MNLSGSSAASFQGPTVNDYKNFFKSYEQYNIKPDRIYLEAPVVASAGPASLAPIPQVYLNKVKNYGTSEGATPMHGALGIVDPKELKKNETLKQNFIAAIKEKYPKAADFATQAVTAIPDFRGHHAIEILNASEALEEAPTTEEVTAAIETGAATVDSLVSDFNKAKGSFKTPHEKTKAFLLEGQKRTKQLQEDASAIVDFADTSNAITSLRDLLKIGAKINSITEKCQKAWALVQKKEAPVPSLQPSAGKQSSTSTATGIPDAAFLGLGAAMWQQAAQDSSSQ